MAKLKDKVENSLNESRTLILGAQVLIGFEFESVFQSGFPKLSAEAQYYKMGGLALMLGALGLLIAPAAYHRIVAQGQDTQGVCRFATLLTSIALLPFAIGLGIDFAVSLDVVGIGTYAVAGGLAAVAVALVMWYGLEVVVRMREQSKRKTNAKPQEKEEEMSPVSLSDKIKQVLIETRIVLPGAQATLGFQFIAILTDAFVRLPPLLQYVHLASLAAVAICTVLLMAPAAYHRIVEEGEESEEFLRFASRMVLIAMVFLALGIAGDFFVVIAHVFNSVSFGLVCAAFILVLYFGLWFGVTGYLRSTRATVGQHA